ncbi:EI24 domain-containing protein [Stakelama sp. CBK3Z-3]|uniref:EI24 domain-containing protein n=1 Tax=Stakelama flava TaxID=2860338 RepID=A0ABS6XP52_9SPHN|nr:EI24 domain-containing protein [Stakelama flava]MBW4331543.1 EI24 domain-containing protein [Stakelama flava]
MMRALFLSIRQFDDPAVARVFLKSFLLTLLIFALFGGALWFGIAGAMQRLIGAGETASGIAAMTAMLATLGAAWLLFRAIAIAVLGLFADDMVRAVEAKHYPRMLASARDVPFGRAAVMGISSALRAIAANLLLTPLYLLLLATGIGTAALFLVVNGCLLGRDLGDMVAARHLNKAAMRDWRTATRWPRFVLGLAVAGLLMVPFVNLVAPVLGAAMATHLFHGKRYA